MKTLAALIAGVSLAATAYAAGMVTVSQHARAFAVATIQVPHGDTLHIVNDDAFLHQVYVDSPGLKFESPEQEPGQSVDLRFPQAGTFAVLCHIHPKMSLQVEAH